jgi:hypothetical protein
MTGFSVLRSRLTAPSGFETKVAHNPARRTLMNIALWIIAGLLAVVFLASGAMKLIQPKEKLASRGVWPHPRTAHASGTSHRTCTGHQQGWCDTGHKIHKAALGVIHRSP